MPNNLDESLNYGLGGDEKPPFRERLRDFFNNHRTAVIIGLVVILVLAIIFIVLAVRNPGNNGGGTPLDGSGGSLPLAGQKGVDFTPKITKTGPGTVVLSWNLPFETDGRVNYGLTEDYGFYADDQNTLTPPNYAKNHAVIVRSLDETKTYHFLASSADREGHVYYSADIVLSAQADSNPPSLSLDLKEGAKLSQNANIKFNAQDDQKICSVKLVVDGRLVEEKFKDFDKGFDLNTYLFINGLHTVTVIASDCTNVTEAKVNVSVDNSYPQARSSQSSVDGTVNSQNPGSSSGSGQNSGGMGGIINNNSQQSPNLGDNSVIEIASWPFLDDFGCKKLNANLSASITKPRSNVTLTGLADVAANVSASGGQAISKVSFLVDYDFLSDLIRAPYARTFDTAYYPDGTHVLKVIAYGNDGSCSDYTDPDSQVVVNFSNYQIDPERLKPFVTDVHIESTDDALNVYWRTTRPTDTKLEFDLTESYGKKVEKPDQESFHQVNLTGLLPDQLYYLRLSGKTSNGIQSEIYRTRARTNTNVTVDNSHGCNQAANNAFYACYYNNKDLTDLRLTRNENGINYSWAAGQTPDAKIEAETFSAIWQGQFFFDGGSYNFQALIDDGARVFVDDGLVIDAWRNQKTTDHSNTINLSRGSHIVKMEYYQDAGSAEAHLKWDYVSRPIDYPTPAGCEVSTNQTTPPNCIYPTPGTYPTPVDCEVYGTNQSRSPEDCVYPTPGVYATPGSYQTPPGCEVSTNQTTPPNCIYPTPGTYQTPGSYPTPGSYQTPGYSTPSSYQTPPGGPCDNAVDASCNPNGTVSAMSINEINVLPGDIFADIQFRSSEAATSTIFYGTSPTNLNRSIQIAPGGSALAGYITPPGYSTPSSYQTPTGGYQTPGSYPTPGSYQTPNPNLPLCGDSGTRNTGTQACRTGYGEPVPPGCTWDLRGGHSGVGGVYRVWCGQDSPFAEAPTAIEGTSGVNCVNAEVGYGYVYDPERSSRRESIGVEIYIDGTSESNRVVSLTTSGPHVIYDDGKASHLIPMTVWPAEAKAILLNGLPSHQVYAFMIKKDGSKVALDGSPYSLRCGNQDLPEGSIDTIVTLDATYKGGPKQCNTLASGWAYDPLFPNQSVTIQVWVSEGRSPWQYYYSDPTLSLAMTVSADDPRPDVNSAKKITGNHGFTIPMPDNFRDNKSRALKIVAVGLTAGRSIDLASALNPVIPNTRHSDYGFRCASGREAWLGFNPVFDHGLSDESIARIHADVNKPEGGNYGGAIMKELINLAIPPGNIIQWKWDGWPPEVTDYVRALLINLGQLESAWELAPYGSAGLASNVDISPLGWAIIWGADRNAAAAYHCTQRTDCESPEKILEWVYENESIPWDYEMPTLGAAIRAIDANAIKLGETLELDLKADPASVSETDFNNGHSLATTLTWTVKNALLCDASGDWSGRQSHTGGTLGIPLTQRGIYTFTLTCQAGARSVSKTVRVTMGTVAPPPNQVSVSLSANKTSLNPGDSLTLTWSSTNATGCLAAGSWSGAKGLNGSETVSPTADSSYDLTCSKGQNSDTKTVTVSIKGPGDDEDDCDDNPSLLDKIFGDDKEECDDDDGGGDDDDKCKNVENCDEGGGIRNFFNNLFSVKKTGKVQAAVDTSVFYKGQIRGLNPSTAYYYKIVSVSKFNKDRKAETGILNFQTTAQGRKDLAVSISWTANCRGNGVVYYDRFAHNTAAGYTGSQTGGSVNAAVIGPDGSGNYRYTAVLIGLTGGTTYHYRYNSGCGSAGLSIDKTVDVPSN